uniref:T-cell receptor alpha/delta variable 31.0 n=1 Tax=Cyprinus carpio TaxID=7962 RepID=A0A8C2I630_CYPCA
MKLWLMETLIILGLVVLGCQSEDTVDQPLKHVTKLEGESVTLDCKYNTTSPSQELFWYIQRKEESPKLVLQRNSYGGGSNGTEFQERFYSVVEPLKSVPLIIQRLCVSDSAVYYCALRPTVLTGCLYLIQNQKKHIQGRGRSGWT